VQVTWAVGAVGGGFGIAVIGAVCGFVPMMVVGRCRGSFWLGFV
jgi:hypothetical protein